MKRAKYGYRSTAKSKKSLHPFRSSSLLFSLFFSPFIWWFLFERVWSCQCLRNEQPQSQQFVSERATPKSAIRFSFQSTSLKVLSSTSLFFFLTLFHTLYYNILHRRLVVKPSYCIHTQILRRTRPPSRSQLARYIHKVRVLLSLGRHMILRSDGTLEVSGRERVM